MTENTARIALVMGSKSDLPVMNCASLLLEELCIQYKTQVVSAHRTPKRLYDFATSAHKQGILVIIAGAGGAAHLPGMIASLTDIPVIGVPVQSQFLNGLDSLLSIAQMPRGTPVATMSIGPAGAANAALLAASILGLHDVSISKRLREWKEQLSASVNISPFD